MKYDEIYRQKPVDKQNYGFSQNYLIQQNFMASRKLNSTLYVKMPVTVPGMEQTLGIY